MILACSKPLNKAIQAACPSRPSRPAAPRGQTRTVDDFLIRDLLEDQGLPQTAADLSEWDGLMLGSWGFLWSQQRTDKCIWDIYIFINIYIFRTI
jgi:hypothetical protein